MKLLPISIILMSMIMSTSYADNTSLKACTDKAITQLDLNECSANAAKAADAELNRVYQAIQKKYHDDPVFIQKLKIAQRAWIQFRDAQINMLYPHSNETNYYGSIFPLCYQTELTRLTNERIKTLQRWLDGQGEGDGCAGSIQS
jgi:uncharacterized protein YecT (DUF1311 family)